MQRNAGNALLSDVEQTTACPIVRPTSARRRTDDATLLQRSAGRIDERRLLARGGGLLPLVEEGFELDLGQMDRRETGPRDQVGEVRAQLADKNVEIKLTERARRWLAEHGYDRQMGARPMSRLIQEKIKAPLAEEILFGRLQSGGKVVVNVTDAAPKSS